MKDLLVVDICGHNGSGIVWMLSSFHVCQSGTFDMLQDPANHKSYAYGQKVFRGEASGEHLIKSCYKADWRLVPKHEEEAFLSVKAEVRPKNVVKSVLPFPPLMQHLIKEQQKEQGLDDMPTLRIAIAKSAMNKAVLDTEKQQAQ